MKLTSRRKSPVPAIKQARFDTRPAAWVRELCRECRNVPAAPGSDGFSVQVLESDLHTLVTVRVADAASLEPAVFERRTAHAYTLIARELQNRVARHPIRLWNYIPSIRETSADGLDRYMVFNAGRFTACSDWFGGPATFDRQLATASGVGHEGTELVVHALAGLAPGIAVENPRQVPSYRYSRRFGPRPPCFARATIVNDAISARPLLLVGGTAAIRGEESVCVGDVAGQVRETLTNLSSLVDAARTSAPAGNKRSAAPLAAFFDLRVYYVREGDRSLIASMVSNAMPQLKRAEYLRADLCRPELLVEIEGVADC